MEDELATELATVSYLDHLIQHINLTCLPNDAVPTGPNINLSTQDVALPPEKGQRCHDTHALACLKSCTRSKW